MKTVLQDMTKSPRKKILFLITKSNWGEKWDGTHFARLAQLFCEYLEQNNERVDSVCKTAPSHPLYKYN
jgi:hypothetical protein